MFDEIEFASEALRASLGPGHRTLVPALYGCLACGMVRMIAAPGAAACRECGAELAVLDVDQVLASETPDAATLSCEAA